MLAIPKVINQIWLGDKPRHSSFVAWSHKWEKLHPNWQIKLWIQDGVDTIRYKDEGFKSSFPDLLAKACHLSQQSNIWRYELIEQFGGLYLDTDMEPIKNIELLLGNTEAFAGRFVTFLNNQLQDLVSPSIFGAVPGHSWLNELVTNMAGVDSSKRGSLGSVYFDAVTKKHPEVTLLEPDVFYPKVKFGPVNAIGVPATTYAVHHSSGRWWPGSYQSLLPI